MATNTKSRRRAAVSGRRASSGRSLKAAALVAGLLAGGFGAAKLFGGKARSRNSGAGISPGAGRAVIATTKVTTTTASKALLQKGQVKSPQVQQLQQALVKLGGQPAQEILATGGADGTYGEGTVRALAAAGFVKPEQVTSAGYQAVLKQATKKVAATTKAVAAVKSGAVPTLPVVPVAVAPVRQPAAAPGKPVAKKAVAKKPVAKKAAAKPAVAKVSAAAYAKLKTYLTPAQLKDLRQRLIEAINERSYQRAISVLYRISNKREYDALNSPLVKFVGDNAAVGFSKKLLASFPNSADYARIVKEFDRILAATA